jgi:hypothetical protein
MDDLRVSQPSGQPTRSTRIFGDPDGWSTVVALNRYTLRGQLAPAAGSTAAPVRPTVRAVVAHARLMLDAGVSFPVILGPDGRVMDGMHRIARVLLGGRGSGQRRPLPDPA